MIFAKIGLGIVCYFAVILPLAVVLGRIIRGPVSATATAAAFVETEPVVAAAPARASAPAAPGPAATSPAFALFAAPAQPERASALLG
jgi:hypothetical protein